MYSILEVYSYTSITMVALHLSTGSILILVFSLRSISARNSSLVKLGCGRLLVLVWWLFLVAVLLFLYFGRWSIVLHQKLFLQLVLFWKWCRSWTPLGRPLPMLVLIRRERGCKQPSSNPNQWSDSIKMTMHKFSQLRRKQSSLKTKAIHQQNIQQRTRTRPIEMGQVILTRITTIACDNV